MQPWHVMPNYDTYKSKYGPEYALSFIADSSNNWRNQLHRR